MSKILISACLLGECVKYSGGHNRTDHPLLKKWQEEGRLISICPEVMGGLSTPRPPAEIHQRTGRIITKEGDDVTNAFENGANATLRIAQENGVKLAVLKQNSPSCGSRQIYDGTFQGHRIDGQGLTTALLREHGIRVIAEDDLDTYSEP